MERQLSGPDTVVRRRRVAGLRRSEATAGLLFSLPAWLLIGAIGVFPIAAIVYLAVRSENLVGYLPTRYVGLENFRTEVFTRSFLHSLAITALITLGGLLIQIPAGLSLAMLLRRAFRGSRLVRSLLLVPMMLTPVAAGLMWRLLLNADIGVIDYGLQAIGLAPVNWLGGPKTALLSIVIVDSWQAIPFTMLMFLAGLTGLPKEPFEAAAMDGATPGQTFRLVTMPLLTPVILVVLIIRTIEGAKLFDLIYILTGGGPGTATGSLSVTIYHTAFQYFAVSQGAALGLALMVLLAPLYFVWLRVTR